MDKKEDLIFGTDTDCVLEISIEHKTFLWMPAKTGTSLARSVLKNFGFKSYKIYDGIIDFSEPLDIHAHSACLFTEHKNYKFIATVRNPYTTLFSEYASDRHPTTEKFKQFLENRFQAQSTNNFYKIWERFPDYIIRVENAYDDYLKVPFIANSEFNTSGKLKKIVDSKPNKNRLGHNNFKLYFNKSIADLIYYNTSRYFDMFGYDKNSWK